MCLDVEAMIFANAGEDGTCIVGTSPTRPRGVVNVVGEGTADTKKPESDGVAGGLGLVVVDGRGRGLPWKRIGRMDGCHGRTDDVGEIQRRRRTALSTGQPTARSP